MKPFSSETKSSVVITGASRGFGRALLHVFNAQGWTVVPVVRMESQASELITEYGHRCRPVIGDVSNESIVASISTNLESLEQPLRVLINNAGIPGSETRLRDVTSLELIRLVEVHCGGAINCARACAPFFSPSHACWILNISSRLGSLSQTANGDFGMEEHSYAYRIAKAALNMATLCMATDKSLCGVNVSSINPGRMQTNLGGSDAPNPPSVSAQMLFDRIIEGRLKSGGFYNLKGEQESW